MAEAEHRARAGEVVLSPGAWALVAPTCDGTPRDRCVRLEAARSPLPERPATPPIAAHAGALAAFLSASVRARVAAGQIEWLSELRRVTVLFIGLPGLDAASPDLLDRAHVALAGDDTLLRLAPLLRDVVAVDLPDNDLTAAMTGEVRAHNTQDLLVGLLRRMVGGGAPPLAIILEDAHWFDSASWALLRQVRAGVAPLLHVVAARPPASPSAEYLRLREAVHVPLAPLEPDETRSLVAERLGHPVAPDLADLIHGRAEGNPFFTDELALARQETGAIEVCDGVALLASAAAAPGGRRGPGGVRP